MTSCAAGVSTTIPLAVAVPMTRERYELQNGTPEASSCRTAATAPVDWQAAADVVVGTDELDVVTDGFVVRLNDAVVLGAALEVVLSVILGVILGVKLDARDVDAVGFAIVVEEELVAVVEVPGQPAKEVSVITSYPDLEAPSKTALTTGASFPVEPIIKTADPLAKASFVHWMPPSVVKVVVILPPELVDPKIMSLSPGYAEITEPPIESWPPNNTNSTSVPQVVVVEPSLSR